jgi:Tol biopolymer transport system component
MSAAAIGCSAAAGSQGSGSPGSSSPSDEPYIDRVILDMPDGISNPMNPRYHEDGESIYFHAQPDDGDRREIYQFTVDTSEVTCVTCGVSPEVTEDLGKPTTFQDGSGQIMVESGNNVWSILEIDGDEKKIVPVNAPPAGATVVPGNATREMRISPDGTHVLLSQIQRSPDGVMTAVPIVGRLERVEGAYEVVDARVIRQSGEGKNWAPDGKGVVVSGGGAYEMGNIDNILVDLATGHVQRLNGNLDYDEDMDLSPNQEWMAQGSMRGLDALTPMSRVVRPAFLAAHIQGSTYEAYANPVNLTNQEWLVSIEDDLAGKSGIPLFADGDGYTARSMPSWSPNGDAVAFHEVSVTDRSIARLVIAHVHNTTSVGPVQGDRVTPSPEWAPELTEYTPGPAPLPETGVYEGEGGGTAEVTEVPDPDIEGNTLRTVTYTDYVNREGMILNGTESTSIVPGQLSIHYVIDIDVSGANEGYLRGDVAIDKRTRKMTPTTPGDEITSELDGDRLVLLDPARIAAVQAGA